MLVHTACYTHMLRHVCNTVPMHRACGRLYCFPPVDGTASVAWSRCQKAVTSSNRNPALSKFTRNEGRWHVAQGGPWRRQGSRSRTQVLPVLTVLPLTSASCQGRAPDGHAIVPSGRLHPCPGRGREREPGPRGAEGLPFGQGQHSGWPPRRGGPRAPARGHRLQGLL